MNLCDCEANVFVDCNKEMSYDNHHPILQTESSVLRLDSSSSFCADVLPDCLHLPGSVPHR